MKTNIFFLAFGFIPLCAEAQIPYSRPAAVLVDSLLYIAHNLVDQCQFDKALEINAAARQIALEQLGAKSPDYGSCCFSYGRMNLVSGDCSEAERWHLQSKLIRENALGKKHPDYARSLLELANVYREKGEYYLAETHYLEAKKVFAKTLGKKHPDYARCLLHLALLQIEKGDYNQAELLCVTAKDIVIMTLGKEHPDYAACLHTLGMLYNDEGSYTRAEPLLIKARDIQDKIRGKLHPAYAASLNSLAALYKKKGDYARAEQLCIEARNIRACVLGKEHADYAQSLSNLADIYKKTGQYANAERLFLEALKIREKALGKEHPDYAGSLHNLAGLYDRKGDYARAERMYWIAKDIRAKTLGKMHPDYAQSLHKLALLYKNTGDYTRSRLLSIEAKDIRAKMVGMKSPVYAMSLHNLAALYHQEGDFVQAEALYLEAKNILTQALGKKHPDYAWNLLQLANLYRSNGDFVRAEQFMNEAKNIQEIVLGKTHQDYHKSVYLLAVLFWEKVEYQRAKPLFLEWMDLSKRQIDQSATYSTESQQLAFLRTFDTPLNAFYSFTQTCGDTDLVRMAYDNALFFSGYLMENSRRLTNAVTATDSMTRATFFHWQDARRRIAQEYAKPIAERNMVAEDEAEAYEKILTCSFNGFAESRIRPRWDQVRDQLKAGEAAIEFIRYRFSNAQKSDSVMYSALVVRPGQDAPHWVTLLEEKQLDKLLHICGACKADYINQLYVVAQRGATPVDRRPETLYDLIWRPLENELSGVQTVYFTAAGLLHRINLTAIPIGPDSILADRYNLVELSSTRYLTVAEKSRTDVDVAALFGGVQYTVESSAIAEDPGFISYSSCDGLDFAEMDAKPRSGSWDYLPHTKKEVNTIGNLLRKHGFCTQTHLAYEASEEAFKRLSTPDKSSPRIVHLATHGFFFPDPDGMRVSELERWDEDEPVIKFSDHPMIRSGLILAGGNHAWKTSKPISEGKDDGILTAYEISQMNLLNTELVVLSACETGLGDIQGNEGVYGLRRAFKIAGAKYLVMSLWQVPDQETSIFMTTFYRHWMESKQTILEAFQTTQHEMRVRFVNPYQWAGFVLVE